MGLFSVVGTMRAIERLQSGQSQSESFSMHDLVNIVVNLNNAANRLPKDQYNRVYALYRRYKSDKTKQTFTRDSYVRAVTHMMISFDSIAPFDEYCGTPEMAQHLYAVKNGGSN